MTCSDAIAPLFLVPPGRQARFALLGMVRAAERMGLRHSWVDLQAFRTSLRAASASPGGMSLFVREHRNMLRDEGLTHVVSYGGGGITDLSMPATKAVGDRTHESLWEHLGLDAVMWWTDHPNWESDGMALEPQNRSRMAGSRYSHFLKSGPAAAEASRALGWERVVGLPVAEDYETLTPAGARQPRHDVVAIVGSLPPVSEVAARWLADDDPEPAAIDRAGIPSAVGRVVDWTREQSGPCEEVLVWAEEVLAARSEAPQRTIYELTMTRQETHAPAVSWLWADARRWYGAQRILRQAAGWRRSFWLAWLARRVDLGVYGCDVSAAGIAQPNDARSWVSYADQSRVYALGKCAININQSHDEAGLTHKPFQIVASGTACVHHSTSGLNEVFDVRREMFAFSRGPQLLHLVDRLCADADLREEVAMRALARARRDHTWDARLTSMLGLHQYAVTSVAA